MATIKFCDSTLIDVQPNDILVFTHVEYNNIWYRKDIRNIALTLECKAIRHIYVECVKVEFLPIASGQPHDNLTIPIHHDKN